LSEPGVGEDLTNLDFLADEDDTIETVAFQTMIESKNKEDIVGDFPIFRSCLYSSWMTLVNLSGE
jgi:hypothetical protein